MNKNFIFCVLFIVAKALSCQNNNDSLFLAIKNHKQKDTVRCLLLLNYYEENRKDRDVQDINIELKKLLNEILNTPSLQQTDKKWYIKLLLPVLLYEGQDILNYTANYPRALNTFFEMLKYANEINDKEGQAAAFNDISTTYFKQKYYKESIQYCLNAIAISRQLNDSIFISSGLSNLAHSYLSINEIEKAETAYIEALKIKEIVEPKRLGVIYNGLGNVWRKRGNLDSSLSFYYKALNLNYKLKLKKLYVRNYENIAFVYLEQKKLKKAEEYAQLSLATAQEIREPEHIKSAFSLLSEIYAANHQFEMAYNMMQRSTKMKDSIINDENKQSLLKAEMNYQATLKQDEIIQLEQQNQITTLESHRKNSIIYSIIAIMILLIISTYFLFTRYKTKKQNELLKTKLEDAELLLIEKQKASDSEIKAIKSQMNPHFFYNALNSIQGFIYSGEKEKAAQSLGIFSDLSRAVLESSRNNEISLHDEIELLENYLKLETMRLPKISYQLNKAPNLNLHDIYLPSMILQPLIENAIKHGLANKQSNGLLTINFEESNNQLHIHIEDDGIGRDAAAEIGKRMIKKSAAFSTNANLSRIELLNENKLEKITQEIIDKKDEKGNALGTIVKLNIPINNND